MKRVELERQAIERALEREANITEAAKALGAARRTLQARMRDYGIPPGQAGRPRQLLPHSEPVLGGSGSLLVVGAVFAAGWWLLRRAKTNNTLVGADATSEDLSGLRGLDVVLAR